MASFLWLVIFIKMRCFSWTSVLTRNAYVKMKANVEDKLCLLDVSKRLRIKNIASV